MAKLSQIIAIEKQTKSSSERELTDTYHLIQKPEPVLGISRTFRPKDEPKPGEAPETQPSEKKKVQVRTEDVLKKTGEILAKLFDVTVTKDTANCQAFARVEIDGQTIIENVPVTYLLFLEKKLVDIRTLVTKLPILDSGESWSYDDGQACWASESVETRSTKKVKKVLVLAQATEKHPAQTQAYDEDEVVGYWKTIKFSGAMPQERQNRILERIDKLLKAVKFAREEANGTIAKDVKVGDKIFGFLFAK